MAPPSLRHPYASLCPIQILHNPYLHPCPQEVWDLRASNASWCHHRDAQHHSPEHFHSPFPAGGMIFPPSSGMLNPWQFSSNTWKLISSVITWLHLKSKKTNTFALFPYLCSLSLNLSLSSYNFVLQALPLFVCLFIMYRLLYPQL